MTNSSISVHEKLYKNKKGVSTVFFKTIKTDGSLEDANKKIEILKKRNSPFFEVRNAQIGNKTVYKKLSNSAHYELKVCLFDKPTPTQT